MAQEDMNITISPEMLQEIIRVASETAIEKYQREAEKSRKAVRDKRLHNTKLLLQNYHCFVEHSKSAVYEASQLSEDDDFEELMEELMSQTDGRVMAHNAISGFDDQSTLKEIAKMIDDVDDMLESYIGKDIIGEPMAELEKLLSPKVEFDWKNITFTFLPHQLRDLDQLVKVLGSLSPDMLGVADIDQHEEFIETITKYQQFANVKNTGAAIHAMIKATEALFDDLHFDESQEWVQLPNLFGSPAIPKEAADTITQALDKMVKEGEIGPKNKWQALEYWAADYLAGK